MIIRKWWKKKNRSKLDTFKKVTEVRKSQIEEGFSPCYSNWWLRALENKTYTIDQSWCKGCKHKDSCNTWL
jgi:hypothetical protein